MECTTLELLPESKHRYRFKGSIFNLKKGTFDEVTLFLDSGCYNTLIPKHLAKLTGHPLPYKRGYKIGGQFIEAEAYSIEKIMLGDFVIERVIAFASDYTGEFSSNILIGTNVTNNWEFTISRKTNLLKFFENPPDDLPNKKNIYQNYFDIEGNYVCIQDDG